MAAYAGPGGKTTESVAEEIASRVDAGSMGPREAMHRLLSINGRLSDDIASLTKQRDYTRAVIAHILGTHYDSQPTAFNGLLVSYVPSTEVQRVDGRAFRTLIGHVDESDPELAQRMRKCMSTTGRAGYVKIERQHRTKEG